MIEMPNISILKKIYSSLIIIFSLLLFIAPLKCIDFLDIDTFNFSNNGMRQQGLRLCLFDTNHQRLKSLQYHCLSGTKSRQFQGYIELDELEMWNFQVDYKGNITFLSSPETGIIRTCGKISGDINQYNVYRDNQEEEKNIVALESFNHDLKSLMGILNVCKGRPSQEHSAKPKFFHYTKNFIETEEKEDFQSLSSNQKENSSERGRLGELMTHMTLFAYGFEEKVTSQDNSNQGIDGIYFKRDFYGELEALFLTESKFQNKSKKCSSIMEEQLNEAILFKNINRLDNANRDDIFNFIHHHPQQVFKGVNRIIRGWSTWLVKKIDADQFESNKHGIYSDIDQKTLFIKQISHHFNSPEEMIQTVFHRYKIIDSQQKIDLFLKSTGLSRDDLKNLIDAEPTNNNREEEQDLNPQVVQVIDQIYSRENLSSFLSFLKDQFPRQALEKINKGLEDKGARQLTPPELSKLSNYEKYSDFKRKENFESLWTHLKEAFFNEYQQYVANNH